MHKKQRGFKMLQLGLLIIVGGLLSYFVSIQPVRAKEVGDSTSFTPPAPSYLTMYPFFPSKDVFTMYLYWQPTMVTIMTGDAGTATVDRNYGYAVYRTQGTDMNFNIPPLMVIKGATADTHPNSVYVDYSVVPNVQYNYKVAGIGYDGSEGNNSSVVSATFVPTSTPSSTTTPTSTPTTTLPQFATNFTATAVSSNQINISWTPVGPADSYILFRSNDPTIGFSPFPTVSGTTTSFADKFLPGSFTAYYRLKTVLSGNETSLFDPKAPFASATTFASSTVTSTIPDNPINLTGTAVSSTQIDLAWTKTGTPDTFKIWRQNPGVIGYVPLSSISGTLTSFSDRSVMPATTYSYRVTAIKDGAESYFSFSPSVTVKTPTSTTTSTVPDNPTGVTAQGVTGTGVILNWTPVGTVDGFKIWRQDPGKIGFSLVTTISGMITTYTDPLLTPGTTYKYVVTSVKGGVDSYFGIAPVVSATTLKTGGFLLSAPRSITEGLPSLMALDTSSDLSFSFITKSGTIARGRALSFNYRYKNNSGQQQRVKLLRQVLDANGAVVATTQGTRVIRASGSIAVPVYQLVNRKWAAGNYSVKLQVLDNSSSERTVLAENEFMFIVK